MNCKFSQNSTHFSTIYGTTTVHVLPLYMHMYYHCTYYHYTCTTTVHVLPLYMYYHCTCICTTTVHTTTIHVLPLYMYYHCTCTTTVHVLPLYMYYHCTYYHCTCTTTVHVLSYHQSVMLVTCLITSSWAMYKMFKNDCQATARNVILATPIRSLLHWGICPTLGAPLASAL